MIEELNIKCVVLDIHDDTYSINVVFLLEVLKLAVVMDVLMTIVYDVMCFD